jgi:hypothetical protein
MPALAAAVALTHGRIDVAWLGASPMTLGQTAGLAARYAVMGCGAPGTAAAPARHAWRRRAGRPQA